MKEKIFKLYSSNILDDQEIGRIVFQTHYKNFIIEKGVFQKKGFMGKDIYTVSRENVEEFLGFKFEGRWSGLWFYKDELL